MNFHARRVDIGRVPLQRVAARIIGAVGLGAGGEQMHYCIDLAVAGCGHQRSDALPGCLLDFGAAKLLRDHEPQDSALTQETGRALSPDYASPEQIHGESPDSGTGPLIERLCAASEEQKQLVR